MAKKEKEEIAVMGGREDATRMEVNSKEGVLEELKQVKRQRYRERLAVSELLGGLDMLSDRVVDLCASQDGMQVVMEATEAEEGGVDNFVASGMSHLHVKSSDSERRVLVNSKDFALSGKGTRSSGGMAVPEVARTITGGSPNSAWTLKAMMGTAAMSGESSKSKTTVHRDGNEKKKGKRGDAPRLKHTPNLMDEKYGVVSMLPYIIGKKKQMKILSKFLSKRILFGSKLKDYSEKVSESFVG